MGAGREKLDQERQRQPETERKRKGGIEKAGRNKTNKERKEEENGGKRERKVRLGEKGEKLEEERQKIVNLL